MDDIPDMTTEEKIAAAIMEAILETHRLYPIRDPANLPTPDEFHAGQFAACLRAAKAVLLNCSIV